MLPTATAKEISVGGTSRSSNEPDMESLPPMAPAQVHLGHQRAEYGGRRLAPAFRLVAQLLEVLLEAQVGLLMLEAGRDQLGQRLDHGQVAPVNWFLDMMYGLKPHAIAEAVVVSPNTGSLATMAMFGVS